MNKTTLKKHYKEHIREVNGFAHKNDSASPTKKSNGGLTETISGIHLLNAILMAD